MKTSDPLKVTNKERKEWESLPDEDKVERLTKVITMYSGWFIDKNDEVWIKDVTTNYEKFERS